MKQLTALLLTLLLLFNLAGYRLFFHYVQEKADAHYEYSLDRNDYDESKMITIKVDLEMPYLADDTGFERVDGEISVDGIVYKYAKRKIHHGQLVLLCLPDENKTKIKSARDEYFSIANNLASHSKQSAPKPTFEKNLASDYEQLILTYSLGHLPRTTKFELPLDETIVSSAHRGLPPRPPESA